MSYDQGKGASPPATVSDPYKTSQPSSCSPRLLGQVVAIEPEHRDRVRAHPRASSCTPSASELPQSPSQASGGRGRLAGARRRAVPQIRWPHARARPSPHRAQPQRPLAPPALADTDASAVHMPHVSTGPQKITRPMRTHNAPKLEINI
eukprot:scaffold1664_cov351-Prasinococcus_capsulatus_cf.AAC.3